MGGLAFPNGPGQPAYPPANGQGTPGGNPFLQQAIQAAQRPTLQGLSETLSRDLPGRFTQGGQFVNPQGSSAFDRAAAIATRGSADALGDIATKMSSGAYEAERGRQQQSLSLSQPDIQSLVTNLQAQGLPRLIEDLGVTRGISDFQSRMNSLLQALQLAGGAGAPHIANTSQSTGESTAEKGIVPALMPKGLQGG